MLTKLYIRNFKIFGEAPTIELGKTVVFIGPNDSGKTSALQAIALWEIGLRKWVPIRGYNFSTKKRPGVPINRLDLIPIPTPSVKFLWHDLEVRELDQSEKLKTKNIRIEIEVEGIREGKKWRVGFEFDYGNIESFYCRLLSSNEEGRSIQKQDLELALKERIAYLPPMSGLAAIEPELKEGRINVLIGEGQTAQILRNLCFKIQQNNPDSWKEVVKYINDLFGIEINDPNYIVERGEITLDYISKGRKRLDLSSAGRGAQQTLLILSFLYSNPGAILLLDEPDAHLEILRQRQTYNLITEIANKLGSQIIAVSHSEVVLNEAANKDIVIAFVGNPHRIDDRGSQVLKSLRDIGWEHYYNAEQMGWVLYLEGSTDLAILSAFAERLNHSVRDHLKNPFLHYVQQPAKARDHFWGIKEAITDFKGLAIFDSDKQIIELKSDLIELKWRKFEIENYLCIEEALIAYARGEFDYNDIFSKADADKREETIRATINEVAHSIKTLTQKDFNDDGVKACEEFLNPVFRIYFEKIGLPILLTKKNYYELIKYIPKEKIDPEITEKLDKILEFAKSAGGEQGSHL